MIPSLLITFREVLEAALIVATVLGILSAVHQDKKAYSVWLAATAAGAVSMIGIALLSLIGVEIQTIWETNEPLIEGIMMTVSSVFITWAVFVLHRTFAQYKTRLISNLRIATDHTRSRAVFLLVFTAVLREGIEVALFLSTVYLSERPELILSGVALGATLALLLAAGVFRTTIRLPVYAAFRTTSMLLIMFAAGTLGKGIREFNEIGLLPALGELTFGFIPDSTSLPGAVIASVFGLSRTMHGLQIAAYVVYATAMGWWVLLRKARPASPLIAENAP